MKRLITALLVLCGGLAHAVDPFSVNKSSFIAGTSHTGCIQATYLDKVHIGVSTSGGVLVLYNSSWTVSSPIISSATLTLGGTYDFANMLVKGICYNAATPTNGVTVLYKS